MEQIVDWLEKLGLSEYGQRFAQNGISVAALRHLTDQDLREIGVLLGHRRIMLAAIAEYSRATESVDQPVVGPWPGTRDGAERRQVTVMFSDLVGSTALAAAMELEDLREVIFAYQNCIAETVRRFGGFVAKYMGDGVLVYFGYPQAHEDDPERAVRAGLQAIAAVHELKSSVPLQTRVGIATGLVVVGDLIGSGEALERGIIGDTPNLAARLQGIAEPNTVVIAENTRRLLGDLFELEDLGKTVLKGIAGPVPVWAVLAPSSAESRFDALRGNQLIALVGREEELDLLRRTWDQARNGDGQVVLVAGEPGIGKSRLTAAVTESLAEEPHTRLRYFCSPHHQDSALHPFIARLERTAGFARDNTAEEKRAKLDALLASGARDMTDLTLIAELLSLPNGAAALELSPQRKREMLFQALLRQLDAVSREQSTLMVFEDAHWIDPTSRELLDMIVERVSQLPIMLIITFRPEFQPGWDGHAHVRRLALNRLGASDVTAMVAALARNTRLGSELISEIVERTDGVPLFVEELTKAVLERVNQDQGVAELLSASPPTALAVPATLHALLIARLDRLGGSAKEVAQVGAVLGREFTYELIAPVAQRPESELKAALALLTEAGLLFCRGAPPLSSYIFKHALVQDAAYGTLLRGSRQQLHARVAVTLEDRFAEIVTAQPGLLARHCTEGGRTERAVVYWLKAGRQAAARSAMVEAVAQLRKGLDMLGGLPDGPWHRQQELDLQMALGPALAATKGFAADDVRAAIARARALAEQIDRPEYLVPLMDGLWAFHFTRAEHKLALAVAEQIEKHGKARNDTAVQLLGYRSQGWTLSFLGEFIAARSLLERCHGLSDPAHRTFGTGLNFDPYASMLANLATTLAYLGYIDQARSRMEEALSEARHLRHAATLAYVLLWANWMEYITCSSELQRRAEELLDLSTEHRFPYWLGWATAFRGRSLAAHGQPRQGFTLLMQGLAALRATGAVATVPMLLMPLAETHAMLGQPGEGLNCLAQATQITVATEQRIDEAELHRLHGDLLNATGDRSGAEQGYRQALGVAERQAAKLFELRAATSLARLWRDQNKRTEARELLAPIYAWFTEGFDTRDLKEAKSLLNGLM